MYNAGLKQNSRTISERAFSFNEVYDPFIPQLRQLAALDTIWLRYQGVFSCFFVGNGI